MVRLSPARRLGEISKFVVQNSSINKNKPKLRNCIFSIKCSNKDTEIHKIVYWHWNLYKLQFLTDVTADSHSIADTVDTDCLSVAAVNRYYCRQINWQLLVEQKSECQNAIGSLLQVHKWIGREQELTPQNNTNSGDILYFASTILRRTKVLSLKFCGQKWHILLRMSHYRSSQEGCDINLSVYN